MVDRWLGALRAAPVITKLLNTINWRDEDNRMAETGIGLMRIRPSQPVILPEPHE